MLSTRPESRLSISLICGRVAEERGRVHILKGGEGGGDNDVYLCINTGFSLMYVYLVVVE